MASRQLRRQHPTRKVRAGGKVLELPENPVELGATVIQRNGQTMTVDEYFVRQNVAGLLVLKDGKIAYERYGLGNTAESRWISFSVTKSVVSMLVGAAIRDGYIESVDSSLGIAGRR